MQENILIIKHGALGDIVLALGTMQEIRRLHPNARMTLLTMASFAGFVKRVGIFDEILIDNRESYFHVRATARVIASLVRGRYDEIYNLQESQRTRNYFAMLRLLAPAGKWKWFESRTNECHSITKKSRLGMGSDTVTTGGIPRKLTDLSEMRGREEWGDLLPEKYVLLIPGCSPKHVYKRWPVENYREIVRRLEGRGISAVLLGTEAEAETIRKIEAGFSHVVSMTGRTSLEDIPQLARRALVVIGNDTGISHMASLSGAFTLAIFDHRNARSVLRGPHSVNLVSEGGVELITPDEVWKHISGRLL